MSTYSHFLEKAERIADDPVHRAKLLKATGHHARAVGEMKPRQWRDWQQARHYAASVKDAALSRLPNLLESFEAAFEARGGKVLWARDAEEAREHLKEIMARHQVRSAIKSKSMISEEIALNEFLEAEGVDAVESDLGELIVQLAGQKPYHIVTPAMHMSKDDIARLFHDKLGTPLDTTAEGLAMAARAHLRDRFITADLGITGANFLVADEGAILLTENEGNARLTMGCPPVHVAIAGIEKVLPRMADLAVFVPLLATSGTGQQVTCYNSIVRGPRQPGEPDGPDACYAILLDNGRSRLYAKPEVRRALRCIRCGACLNSCPVYRTVGGHTYGTTYQGPIGAVITPHLRGMANWQHLPQASSLCGACSEVCPVEIDLHSLILHNRWAAERESASPLFWRLAMRGWAAAMATRGRMQLANRFYRLVYPLIPTRWRRLMPAAVSRTFADRWSELAGQPPPRARR